MAKGGYYNTYMTGEWNINQVFAEELRRLLENVNTTARTGNVKEWLNDLRILWRNLYGHKKIPTALLKDIDARMVEARKRISVLPPVIMYEKLSPMERVNFDGTMQILDKANTELINAMYQADLIFPVKEKDARMAGLEI